MAATNIAASHVSASITKHWQVYGPTNDPAEHIRYVKGTITVDVGSGNTAVYTTAAGIPLTNLFDSTNDSFIDIDQHNIFGGEDVWASINSVLFKGKVVGGSSPEVTLYVTDTSDTGSETGLDELANTTDTGQQSFTIPFLLIGRKKNI